MPQLGKFQLELITKLFTRGWQFIARVFFNHHHCVDSPMSLLTLTALSEAVLERGQENSSLIPPKTLWELMILLKYWTLLLPLAQRFQTAKTRQKLVHLMWFHKIFQASFSGFQQIHTISVSGHFIHSCSCFKPLQAQGWSILRIFSLILGRFLQFGPIVVRLMLYLMLCFTLWCNKQDGNFHMCLSILW